MTGFIGDIGAGNYYGLDATYGARMGAAFRRYLMSGSGEMTVARA